jgi:Zn-dependent peptidase ImmA (M78 family)
VPPRSKEAARRLALEVRNELGLAPLDPLDPRQLARLYGVPVLTIGQLRNLASDTAEYLLTTGRAMFSAALVPLGTAMFIIDNDSHADTRRRASLAHEMAHILWEHSFTSVLVNADGCRAVHPDVEEEADRLSHELLIPTAATRTAARHGWTDEAVAAAFGVSLAFARMRMNRSGARLIARRACRRRRTPQLHGRTRRPRARRRRSDPPGPGDAP